MPFRLGRRRKPFGDGLELPYGLLAEQYRDDSARRDHDQNRAEEDRRRAE